MKKIILVTFSSILILPFFSCLHKNDLSTLKEVSFANDIHPILAANCTQSNCHSNNGGEFPLVTYEEVMSGGEIKAGDAHGSNLYQTISNHGFVDAMPPDPLPPLSTDQIKLVYIWIEQGAKNN
ncbi:MAG: hypothetical protein IPN61_12005 [Bacteroidetes bacterium]|nr:hypothetical protein [Bacteroidota bacterium]MBP6427436.1 hypothetical protein [Bacteroidia bacterium]